MKKIEIHVEKNSFPLKTHNLIHSKKKEETIINRVMHIIHNYFGSKVSISVDNLTAGYELICFLFTNREGG